MVRWMRMTTAACGAIALWCADAEAQEVDPTWLSEQLRALNSDELATRESAQLQLRQNPLVKLEDIERALIAPGLSGESLLRLRQVGIDMFKKRDRAAMGVSWQSQSFRLDGLEIAGPARARVGGVEFDSVRLLRAGDVIVKFDGLPVVVSEDIQRNWDNCRAMIMSHDPGDEIELDILRDERPMKVRLKMGRYRDLGQSTVADPRDVIERSFEYRLNRIAKSAGVARDTEEPAELPITQSEWESIVESENKVREQRFRAAQEQAISGPLPQVTAAGGEADLSGDATMFFRAGQSDQTARMMQTLLKSISIKQNELQQLQRMIERTPDGPAKVALERQAESVQLQIKELQRRMSIERTRPQIFKP